MSDTTAASYTTGERYPVEMLFFKTAPEHVEAFLKADHEVWTLGEAYMDGLPQIPFLYKEVWLNDNKPGEITIVIVWQSIELWNQVGDKAFQDELLARFDKAFGKPYTFLGAQHEQEQFGVHRVSRFERNHL